MEANKEKIALFDFCETLANFQTGDAFVYYVRDYYPQKRTKIRAFIHNALRTFQVIRVLERLFPRASINKRLVLWQLKGYTKDLLERASYEYYTRVVKPNLINRTIQELEDLQSNGWRIFIVSAGYEIYLKHFCHDFNIKLDDLIAVKIAFEGNKCKGCFEGGDRLYDKDIILTQKIDKEKAYTVAYSDSKSDLPMLQWANEGIVIRRSDKHSWSKEYNFKEIVWE
jgi:HAD superfamily phosphoserine phosphatase-like hydrolase